MDKLETEIKNLPEIEFPEHLHARILGRVFWLRFCRNFYLILTLLSANLLVSGWRVWTRMADLDTISVFRALWDGAEFSLDFFTAFWQGMSDALPAGIILIFLINLILVFASVRLYAKLNNGLKLNS